MVDVLFLSDGYFAVWWLTYPTPLKNDGLRHLGLWHSQLNGKMKFMLKIWKSVGMMKFPTEWKVIKVMFQSPPTSINKHIAIGQPLRNHTSQSTNPASSEVRGGAVQWGPSSSRTWRRSHWSSPPLALGYQQNMERLWLWHVPQLRVFLRCSEDL